MSNETSILLLLESLSPEELTILVGALGLMLTKGLSSPEKIAFANLLLTTGSSILTVATIELALAAPADIIKMQADDENKKKMAKEIEELQLQVKKILQIIN